MTVLSFHPCFPGDRYIHCAGRSLTEDKKAAMGHATAVILHQACGPALYAEAQKRCRHVFPDFSTRFTYPGKIGQAELFSKIGVAHPETMTYKTVKGFFETHKAGRPSLDFPLVFKLDKADEGHGVFPVTGPEDLPPLLDKARAWERTGQAGFLLQRYVPPFFGVLRVVVIYKKFVAYWRVAGATTGFAVNIARGADIDDQAHPELREKGIAAVQAVCKKTGINLAGFDLIFPAARPESGPLFLEINYYFGRRGLGGSERYYTLLTQEINRWLKDRQIAA